MATTVAITETDAVSTPPPAPVRRIVTGHHPDGRSVVASDGSPSRVFDDLGEPGLVFHEIWNVRSVPATVDRDDAEPPEERLTLAPPKGGVRLRVLDIPPDSAAADFDAVFDNIGGGDARVASTRHRSFHRTESIDFGIVLDGEIVLLLDDSETTVHAGEIVVQRGTNHGWVNRTDRPCRIAFVLVDGSFSEELRPA